MRIHVCAAAALLLSSGACLAQVSTMGTTAMAVPTTPGAVVSSPLAGPGPFTSLFSATTVPGAPATTLASPPLAQDPTLPGTSVNCAPTEVELSPSVESVTSTNTSASPTSALSALGTIPSMSGSTAPTSTSLSPTLPAAMPVTIVGTVIGSTTGTIAPAPVLGSSTPGSTCTSAPGDTLTNAAALPASTPDVPQVPPPGAIQSPTVDVDTANTSISPAPSVMPTPNTAACSESISMDLANPTSADSTNTSGNAAAMQVVSPPAGC